MNIFNRIESLQDSLVKALSEHSRVILEDGMESPQIKILESEIKSKERGLVSLREEALSKICEAFSDEYISSASNFLRMHFDSAIFNKKYIAKCIGVSTKTYSDFLSKKEAELPKISTVKLLCLFADSNFTTWNCFDYASDIETIEVDGVSLTRENINGFVAYDFPHCIRHYFFK